MSQSSVQPSPDPSRPATPRAEFRCVGCGYVIRGLAVDSLCPECGTPVMRSIGAGIIKPTSGSAVASLVLGIVGLLGCGTYGVLAIICGPLAIYYASKARRQIREGSAGPSSAGLATAGKILGIIATVAGGLILAFIAIMALTAFAPHWFP